MKKIVKILLVLLLALGITGCQTPKWIKNWFFQYNVGTDDYSLFFGLFDEKDNELTANGVVKVRIVNDKDEVVYDGEKEFSKDDFRQMTFEDVDGVYFMADVRFDSSEITPGSSKIGKVYFTVETSNVVFEECNCDAYLLPSKPIEIAYSLPMKVKLKSYWSGYAAKYTISEITYQEDVLGGVNFTITGKKTYKGPYNLGINEVGYKIYDSGNSVVASGTIRLQDKLKVGDKFKDSSLTIYDLQPGEKYTFKIVSTSE